jgi:hypothetical protein
MTLSALTVSKMQFSMLLIHGIQRKQKLCAKLEEILARVLQVKKISYLQETHSS